MKTTMSPLTVVCVWILFAGVLMGAIAQTPDSRIRLNSIGFLPDFPKKASIAAKCTEFTVNDPITNTVLFTGTTDSIYNTDTRESLWIADFSELVRVGTYYINVPGVGRSYNFRIAGSVFKEPFRTMMLGMYLWRCGSAVNATFNGVEYNHPACHTQDGNMLYITGRSERRDGAGGWHDAGDYNKYVVNSGVTVGLMLKAWEQFWFALDTVNLAPVTNTGTIPAYLTEVKWNLDWVAKMQYGSNDGRVSHKLSTLRFGSNMMPDRETTVRYFVPWGTSATGAFTGMLAQASRLYRPYDATLADRWLVQAQLSYKTLSNNPTFIAADQSAFDTGPYDQSNSRDQRMWAAAELWETTGEQQYLEYLENNLTTSDIRNTTEWANVQNFASLTYLNSKREGRNPELVERLVNQLINVANGIISTTGRHGYGRTFGITYYWGTNGAVAATTYTLQTAYRLTGDVKYRHTAQDALSYLLGRNYFARSFVTQVGHRPPQSPHCRRSIASGKIWPGYLIGGPHNGRGDLGACDNGAGTCWEDIPADYYTNEIAINWNAAMIYALAGMLPGTAAYPAPNYPGQPDEIVSVRHTTPARKAQTAATAARIVKVQNNRHTDIPPGASVYGLNGRLIAKRGINDTKIPVLKKNGVYIIKIRPHD